VALVVITIAPNAAIQYFLEGSGEEKKRDGIRRRVDRRMVEKQDERRCF